MRIPDYGQYELKAQRRDTGSLVTLFHNEPSPRRVVVQKLLPHWGWRHQTLPGEQSFRQTISGTRFTDRGFKVRVDRDTCEVCIDFDIRMIQDRHDEWRLQISSMPPDEVHILRPTWTFDKLSQVLACKLHSLIIVTADVRYLNLRSYEKNTYLFADCQVIKVRLE